MTPQDKNSAIAAALILIGLAGLFYVMPRIVLSLGEISPWLGGAAAFAFIFTLYIVFWLRGKYLSSKSRPE